MAVRRVLATADPVRLNVFTMVTGFAVNWLEVRENPRHEGKRTALGTVFEESFSGLQAVAQAARDDLTVEEVVHEDDQERYRILVGEPGSGWGQVGVDD